MTTIHYSTVEGEFGNRIDAGPQPLIHPNSNLSYGEVWSCFAGFLPAVIRVLTDQGYEVDESDVTVEPLPARQSIRHRQYEIIDNDWLDFVRDHDRGVIRYSSLVKLSWLILQIARAWPHLSIAVAVSKWKDATMIDRELGRRADVSVASCSSVPDEFRQILVATDAFLSRHDVIENRDILIVLDASQFGLNMSIRRDPRADSDVRLPWETTPRTYREEIQPIRDKRRLEFLQRARNARVYAFLPDDVRLPPLTRDTVTAVFGFDDLTIPEHGRVFEPPVIVPIRFAGGMPFREHDAFNVQRKGIWRCKKRNQFVRHVCTAIQRREFAGLPTAAGERLAEWFRDVESPWIGVLATNLEHACRLGRCMPWATLLAKDGASLARLSERDRRWISQQLGRESDLMIVTPAGLRQIPALDVLVRADGGVLDLTRAVNGHGCPFPLIIDIQDRHHPLLRRYRDQRLDHYRDSGWPIIDGSEPDAVETFLATRGKKNRSRSQLGRRIPVAEYSSVRAAETSSQGQDENSVVMGGPDDNNPDPPPSLDFEQTFSRDALFECFWTLKATHGHAPGIDNITYDDLSPTEVGHIADYTSQVVLAGTFKPFPPRPVKVPKKEPGEFRTLQLGVIRDRLVGKALCTAMTPYFERIFFDGSHGFRQRRSPQTMLAHLEATMIRTGHRVLAGDDITKAFNNVNIDHCLAAHEQLFQHQVFEDSDPAELSRFLRLIEVILRGHDPQREIEINQGEPYSPMAMNVQLHAHLDSHFEASGVNWFRYADNLVYLTSGKEAGRAALEQASEHVQEIDMALKGEPGTAIDISAGETASLLGVELQWREGRLHYQAASGAWESLQDGLRKAWESSSVLDAGRRVVEGWIAAYGWTFADSDQLIRDVVRCAAENGVRELDRGSLRRKYQRSCESWRGCRQMALEATAERNCNIEPHASDNDDDHDDTSPPW